MTPWGKGKKNPHEPKHIQELLFTFLFMFLSLKTPSSGEEEVQLQLQQASRCPAVKGERQSAGGAASGGTDGGCTAAAAAAAGRSDGNVCCMLPECLRRSEAKGRGGLLNKEEGLPDVSAHRLRTSQTVKRKEETAGRWHSSSTQRVHSWSYGGPLVPKILYIHRFVRFIVTLVFLSFSVEAEKIKLCS